jgi:hypothetical protein
MLDKKRVRTFFVPVKLAIDTLGYEVVNELVAFFVVEFAYDGAHGIVCVVHLATSGVGELSFLI